MRRTTQIRPHRRHVAWLAAACVLAAATGTAVAEEPVDPVVPLAAVPETVAEVPIGTELPTGGESFTEPAADGDVVVETPGGEATDTPAEGIAAPTTTDDLEGSTDAELRALRARLVAQRDTAQARLLELERTRVAAETRLDTALDAWSRQLVALYDLGDGDRLRALVDLRDATDPATREALVAALMPADRLVVAEYDAARGAVDPAAAAAEAARSQVLALGTRVDAATAAIAARATPTGADSGGAGVADRFAVDADLVFATGPIPGIGYWGAVSGGGMLTGWMGMAGAAVGGIGCTPPDPALQATGAIEQGEASWYGPGFDGQATASGETYDQTALTAAHRTLPFGTVVRVYSSVTARCTFVRITDRGPFIDGRIIDLSRGAADQIGMESVAPVQVEVWSVPTAAPAAAPVTP